jgi:hypothetical protein
MGLTLQQESWLPNWSISCFQGLANVVPLEWLQMFNNKELQVLISGAQIPVDVEDLKQHTNYTGGYTSDHPTIRLFWKVHYWKQYPFSLPCIRIDYHGVN